MLGAMIGDIAGSVYEFNNIKSKDFEFFGRGCKYTDDTVLTSAIAAALIGRKRNAAAFPELCMVALRSAYFAYPEVKGGYGPRFASWAESGSNEPYFSCGNGSAMRVSPCGFAAGSLEEALELAEISAAATHNHPDGIAGAKATAAAVYLARTGKSKDEIREYISENFYTLEGTVDSIRPGYDWVSVCNGTVQPAIIAFLDSVSFEDAIRNAVSLGGDSDTIAAITGGIAEAYYGIPEEIAAKGFSLLPNTMRALIARFYEEFLAPLPASIINAKAPEKVIHRVADIHMHVNFGVDDGSKSAEESIKTLKKAAEQGVTDVICTSHSYESKYCPNVYRNNFQVLQDLVKSNGLNIRLYPGSELSCQSGSIMRENLEDLKTVEYLPLNGTKYVLSEFWPYSVNFSEIDACLNSLLIHGYTPIVAHAERYPALFEEAWRLPSLTDKDVLFQVNAYDLSNDCSSRGCRHRARTLLRTKRASFIGSDSHGEKRPPALTKGVDWIYDNCEEDYADAVCFGNAEKLLGIGK